MKAHILIIDDDEDTLTTFKLALQRKGGYTVTTVANPHRGWQLFQTGQPDLVLLDVLMPGLSGWGVCARIRQTSSAPIIMLTALDTEADVVRGFELGADDYITKPVSAEILLARIEAVLRRANGGPERPRPGSVAVVRGEVTKGVEVADGLARFSLRNEQGTFFIRAYRLAGQCAGLKKGETVGVIGRLRSAFDRRRQTHRVWLQAAQLIPAEQAEVVWQDQQALAALLRGV